MSTTIAAIATALSNSGISIIRISGKDSLEIANKLFRGTSKSIFSTLITLGASNVIISPLSYFPFTVLTHLLSINLCPSSKVLYIDGCLTTVGVPIKYLNNNKNVFLITNPRIIYMEAVIHEDFHQCAFHRLWPDARSASLL